MAPPLSAGTKLLDNATAIEWREGEER